METHQGIAEPDCNRAKSMMLAAVTLGRADMLQNLIDEAEHVDAEWLGTYAATFATHFRDQACLQALVGAGVDVDKEDYNGITPAMMACRLGNEQCLRFLIEHGADLSKTDKEGRTPADIAKELERGSCAEIIRASMLVLGERAALASATAADGQALRAARPRSL